MSGKGIHTILEMYDNGAYSEDIQVSWHPRGAVFSCSRCMCVSVMSNYDMLSKKKKM